MGGEGVGAQEGCTGCVQYFRSSLPFFFLKKFLKKKEKRIKMELALVYISNTKQQRQIAIS
jgi:hypothetical protein